MLTQSDTALCGCLIRMRKLQTRQQAKYRKLLPNFSKRRRNMSRNCISLIRYCGSILLYVTWREQKISHGQQGLLWASWYSLQHFELARMKPNQASSYNHMPARWLAQLTVSTFDRLCHVSMPAVLVTGLLLYRTCRFVPSTGRDCCQNSLRDGQAELIWVADQVLVSGTNSACSVTSLMVKTSPTVSVWLNMYYLFLNIFVLWKMQ